MNAYQGLEAAKSNSDFQVWVSNWEVTIIRERERMIIITFHARNAESSKNMAVISLDLLVHSNFPSM